MQHSRISTLHLDIRQRKIQGPKYAAQDVQRCIHCLFAKGRGEIVVRCLLCLIGNMPASCCTTTDQGHEAQLLQLFLELEVEKPCALGYRALSAPVPSYERRISLVHGTALCKPKHRHMRRRSTPHYRGSCEETAPGVINFWDSATECDADALEAMLTQLTPPPEAVLLCSGSRPVLPGAPGTALDSSSVRHTFTCCTCRADRIQRTYVQAPCIT